MLTSNLGGTLTRIADQSAEAISDFLRSNSPALNRHIRRALSVPPGQAGSLMADPVIEVAQDWAPAEQSFGQLSGNLLDPRLVEALDQAKAERMPRNRHPYLHQVKAWRAAEAGQSVLVSSGTGSGKTECFMIPILNDILRNPTPGGGIRAIIVYPLNALIQSQRDRLSAWAEGLGGSVTYALYNGETPEKDKGLPGGVGEILDRKSLRLKPPSILVTNITMLEYMLLRAQDQPILDRSKGLLRWIVLDEAHSYVGAQASEMAMLLRRVRAGFGVAPEDVRLMATSATIEDDTGTRLSEFLQGLSGAGADRVTVLKGEAVEAKLSPPVADGPLDILALGALPDDAARWNALERHPRVQSLRARLKSGLRLGEIAQHAFGQPEAVEKAEMLLDLVAQARPHAAALPLLRWRGHLFLRALGGAWACVDGACPHASAELRGAKDWPFGQVHFALRERCSCGAPCMELVICNDCGTPHLTAMQDFGVNHRLILPRAGAEDDFAADVETGEGEDAPAARLALWVSSVPDRGRVVHLDRESLEIHSNQPEALPGQIALKVIDSDPVCPCNETRTKDAFKSFRFSPAYLMGQNMQTMIEAFSLPDPDPAKKPLAGRGAISFTDSRQGVARLAAKMQAEAERNLTRAFLWHEVQSAEGPVGSSDKIAGLEKAIAAMKAVGQEPDAILVDMLVRLKAEQTAVPGVKWQQAVADLAAHPEVGLFLSEVWKDRGNEFVNRTEDLAQILLMREIMRRPTRQNNAETLGLARLAFPELERAALDGPLPAALQGRGVAPADWLGLVLSAVDLFFREKMVVDLNPTYHMRWIAPKWGRLRQACSNDVDKEHRLNAEPFPTALGKLGQRLHRVALNALALTGGSRDNDGDLEEADALLREVYKLIVKHACKTWSQHAVALDFDKARLEPYRQAYACPLSRRIFAYAIKGGSPLDPSRPMQRITVPAAPFAQRGGLTAGERAQLADWLAQDPAIATLKEQGHWTGLHSRAVLYSPYMRAQEHSAQLQRRQLKDYEDEFNAGKINLLACSTTMEMGVDLSNVGLVVNSNVPPSVANYRQRVGRAGRRREPWAFGVTWCRDLPLDNQIFQEPRRLLQGRMAPPRVALNSPILIQRHVNAAAFAGWLRQQGGIGIKDQIGPFFGMDAQGQVTPNAGVDRFLATLTGPEAEALLPSIEALLRGSSLAGVPVRDLTRRVANEMRRIVQRWRGEYLALVQRRDASGEKDVSKALDALAENMHGAFLLSELSKEGFTPAYGFPSDVVTFDHIGGRKEQGQVARDEYLGRAGASRTLDVALREYAPGADIVINSLVYTSEGIRPAWSSQASASHLEDLRRLVRCATCDKVHLSRDLPEICDCGAAIPPDQFRKTLRPVGFVGRSEPHIGYELLRATAFRMPEISADDAGFLDLPGEAGFRLRATPKGQVISLGSGEAEQGYAICLVCGRAAAEQGLGGPLPPGMTGHRPLVTGASATVVSGRCIGGDGAGRIQRNVHLVHDRATDVFELQMPHDVTRGAAFAFAAGLREAMAAWLGVETGEMGLAVRPSRGADQTKRVSAFLFDHAAGGAGLSLRLGEEGRLAALAADVLERLTCPESCENGCPACILRPDMNMAQILPDRPAGAELARRLRDLLALDPRRKVFGPDSHAASQSLFDLISQHVTRGTALSVTLFARGAPGSWDLPEWPVSAALRGWQQQVPVEVVFSTAALQDPQMDIPTRLHLMRIAGEQGLTHAADLPTPRLMPVLAAIRTADGLIGVAAAASSESRPDGDWGAGQADILVCGPMEPPLEWSVLPASALLPAVEAGKSAYVIMKERMNTATPWFGRAFWSMVAQEAPALTDLLTREGVAEIRYDDRYVRQPLHFKLLREVVLAVPGRNDATGFRLHTMLADPKDRPSRIDHALATDEDREALFNEMFPGDRLFIGRMDQTEHPRFFTLTTRSGGKAMIYLDQGFDLWRAPQKVPVVHGGDMGKLALQLDRLDVSIATRSPHLPAMFLCVL